MAYPERVVVLGWWQGCSCHGGWLKLEGLPSQDCCASMAVGQLASGKRRVASWVMEPLGCLPQNKSLSREKPCLAKIPVCHGMKEVAMV